MEFFNECEAGVKGGKFCLDGEKQIPYLGAAGCVVFNL